LNDAQIALMQFFSISAYSTGVISTDKEMFIASMLNGCRIGAKYGAAPVQLHRNCTAPEA
jgi:hypothetical protein